VAAGLPDSDLPLRIVLVSRDDSSVLGKERMLVIIGAILAAIFLGLGYVAVGQVHDGQAENLIPATMPAVRFLASGVIAASATILALMLTLLGMSQSSDDGFADSHYDRIRTISKLNVAAMIGAVFLLTLLTIPVTESEELSRFYDIAYYTIIAFAASIGGLIIGIALKLYLAVVDLIDFYHPERESGLVRETPQSPRDEG